MVIGDTVHRHKMPQIIFVRKVVSAPSDHIEWRMVLWILTIKGETKVLYLFRNEEGSLEFVYHAKFAFTLLKPGDRHLEAVRICQSIGTNRTQLGQLKVRAENLWFRISNIKKQERMKLRANSHDLDRRWWEWKSEFPAGWRQSYEEWVNSKWNYARKREIQYIVSRTRSLTRKCYFQIFSYRKNL